MSTSDAGSGNAKPHNMEEIMAAIQKVLADHDVSQARVVLELFDEADQRQQQQRPVEEVSSDAGATAVRAPTPPPKSIKTEGLLLPLDLHADAPMRSPERQTPPPRPRSSSEHCTHMVSPSGTRTSPNPPPALPAGHRLGQTPSTPSPPPAPDGDASPQKELGSASLTEELEHTARPTAPAEPAKKAAAVVPAAPSTEAAALSRPDAEALDPSALLPQDLFQELNQQQNRAERLAILKSFVGKSVLLDDKKQREALKKQTSPPPTVNAFLSQYRSGSAALQRQSTASGATSPSKATPARTTAVLLSEPASGATPTLPTVAAAGTTPGVVDSTTVRGRKGPHVPGKNPIFGILNKDSALAESRPTSHNGASGSLTSVGARRQNSVSVKEEPPKPKSPQHRPAIGERAARHQPDSILRSSGSTSPTDGTDKRTPVGRAEGLPVLPATTTSTGSLASHPTTLGTGSPVDAAFPLLDKQSFTATCRENAQRAAQMRTGLSSSTVSPSYTSPTSGAARNTAAGSGRLPARHPSNPTGAAAAPMKGGTSLKDMLREQQRMEKESEAALREHAQTMEKARKFLQEVEGNETVKSHLDVLRAERAVDGATAPRTVVLSRPAPAESPATPPEASVHHTAPQPAAPTPRPPPAERAEAHPPRRVVAVDHAPQPSRTEAAATPPPAAGPSLPTTPQGSPRRSVGAHGSSGNSPRSSTSGGIQVVKFTMPTERAAKEAVVAQLSRSPAGPQHLSTKDRYAAMLAGQNQIIQENEGKNQQYQTLVERAVAFNEALRGGGGGGSENAAVKK